VNEFLTYSMLLHS